MMRPKSKLLAATPSVTHASAGLALTFYGVDYRVDVRPGSDEAVDVVRELERCASEIRADIGMKRTSVPVRLRAG